MKKQNGNKLMQKWNSNEGEGLLFYGNVIIPFVDRFPKNSLYKIMTTRLEETSEAG